MSSNSLHFFLGSEYLGTATGCNGSLHPVLRGTEYNKNNLHFFCPLCGEVWARVLSDAAHTWNPRNHAVYCECPNCLGKLRNFTARSPSLIPHFGQVESYLGIMPKKALQYEFLFATDPRWRYRHAY